MEGPLLLIAFAGVIALAVFLWWRIAEPRNQNSNTTAVRPGEGVERAPLEHRQTALVAEIKADVEATEPAPAPAKKPRKPRASRAKPKAAE